ncbi:MAG: hypothetical protein O7D94_13520 [Planctomycetota bacterium]|nr:hypothetical protein [Planctomycetota bacterium]
MFRASQTKAAEPQVRSNVPAGAIVAVAALLGFAGSVSASDAFKSADRAVIGIARSIAHPGDALIASSRSIGWAAAALIILLWLGRRFPIAISRLRRDRRVARAACPAVLPALRRSCSISYRSGGLYGP